MTLLYYCVCSRRKPVVKMLPITAHFASSGSFAGKTFFSYSTYTRYSLRHWP